MWWWEQIPQRELGPIRGPLPATLMPPRRYSPNTLTLTPQPVTYARPHARVVTASQVEANMNAGGSGVPASGGDRGNFDRIAADQSSQSQSRGVSNGNGTTNGIGAALASGFGRAALGFAARGLGVLLGGPVGGIVASKIVDITLGRGLFATVDTPTAIIAPDAPLTIPDGFQFVDPYSGVPSAIPDTPPDATVMGPTTTSDPFAPNDQPAAIDAVKSADPVGIGVADLSEEMQADVKGPGIGGTGQVGQDITGGESFGGQTSGGAVGGEVGSDPSGGAGGDLGPSGGGGGGEVF